MLDGTGRRIAHPARHGIDGIHFAMIDRRQGHYQRGTPHRDLFDSFHVVRALRRQLGLHQKTSAAKPVARWRQLGGRVAERTSLPFVLRDPILNVLEEAVRASASFSTTTASGRRSCRARDQTPVSMPWCFVDVLLGQHRPRATAEPLATRCIFRARSGCARTPALRARPGCFSPHSSSATRADRRRGIRRGGRISSARARAWASGGRRRLSRARRALSLGHAYLEALRRALGRDSTRATRVERA